MGNTFRKLLDNLFGNKEMRVVMLGASVRSYEKYDWFCVCILLLK